MLRTLRAKAVLITRSAFLTQVKWTGTDAYLNRHIGSNKHETEIMLKTVGKDSLQELVLDVIPPEIIRESRISPFAAQSEIEARSWLKSVGSQNKIFKNMIGQGYYESIIPPAIVRNVLENPMWYTPYLPIHPEISQGHLEAVLNAQTLATEMTGMDISSAATPCLATGCSEAMMMAFHFHECKRKKFFVSSSVFPSLIANMTTRAEALGYAVVVGPVESMDLSKGDVAGILVQTPSADGQLHNFSHLFNSAKKHGVLCCCATDLLSCAILTPPGEMNADIVIASGQRFGLPLGYGGPHVSFISTKFKYKHLIPGQLVGVSHDDESSGPAIRLVLRGRETYAKKEHSTSFVDNAPFLSAIVCGFYAMYHGARGLIAVANEIHHRAAVLAAGFQCLELKRKNANYFDTITLQLDAESSPRLSAASFVSNCLEKGINVYHNKEYDTVSLSVDQRTTDSHVHIVLEAAGMKQPNISALGVISNMSEVIPKDFKRKSKFLSGAAFESRKSETELMRYVQRLQRKDFGLTHGMIPMGSCTMKLNSAVVVQPLLWSEFISLHPYAPEDQTRGISTLIIEFKRKLCDIFGMTACSIQPNSAAQGVYSGLRMILFYQKGKSKTARNVCFIPSPDAGTNAAAAALAGLEVVYLKTTERGFVDMEDLELKGKLYGERLSSLLITLPNSCGVYDPNIRKINDMIHSMGGQTLLDGIHMNAMVGYTGPGFIDVDVCTIPLHKTFGIPHATGGGGVCALLVRHQLAPYLPNSVVGPRVGGSKGYGVVAQSGFGSASLVCSPNLVLTLLGSRGIKTCTEYAILNANYLKKRLEREYTVLALTSEQSCAHQFILDLRTFKESANITAFDVAKRLIDYGFHPPTINFPIEDTLVIEPTESECLHELDRFADALLSIRKEIRDIERGLQPREGNVLKRAPHTAKAVTGDKWNRPYSRRTAAYPTRHQDTEKYWPAVGRVDRQYGDDHLLCTSTPLEFYY